MTKSIMSNKIIAYFIIFIGLISVQASCKHTKVGGTGDCPSKEVEELTSKLKHQIQKDFDFYYAKVKVDIKDSKQSNSFSTSIKMKPDSAFSGTVKKAAFVGAQFKVDVDTVAYTMKLEKCYKKGSFETLSETFGTEVSYQFMQQLVLGQAVGVDSLEELYPLKDDQYYILASHDKKAFQRLDAYNLSDEERNDVFIKYILDCKSLKLVQIEINVPKDHTVIKVDFVKRQDVEGVDLPEETSVKIVTPEDSVFIDLEYTKTRLNDPKRIWLSIPDSYNECP